MHFLHRYLPARLTTINLNWSIAKLYLSTIYKLYYFFFEINYCIPSLINVRIKPMMVYYIVSQNVFRCYMKVFIVVFFYVNATFPVCILNLCFNYQVFCSFYLCVSNILFFIICSFSKLFLFCLIVGALFSFLLTSFMPSNILWFV